MAVLFLITAVFLVFSALLCPSLVYSQCILGKRLQEKEFPDMSKIAGIGYTATVEVTFLRMKQTIIATEYYDVVNARGRVNFLETGQTKQVLYFNDTMETFNIQGFRCETKHLDEFAILFGEEMVRDWTYIEDDRVVLGPSGMLWNAHHRYAKEKVNYMGVTTKNEYIRGIPADHWIGCLNDDQLIVDYYFSVKEWHSEYGTSIVNVPLRIEIRGQTGLEDTPQIDEIYEFVHFMPNILDQRKVFSIPTGAGCNKRLAKDLPVAPSFDAKDISYKAELTYTEPGNNDHSYVTNVHYVEDDSSGDVGIYSSTWSKVDKNGVRTPSAYKFIVYNKRNGLLFNLTMDRQSCIVSRVEHYDDSIPLPGSISVNIDNLELLSKSGQIYIGKSKRRGIPTDVFEESSYLYGDDTTDDFAAARVTRFYVSENSEYATESQEEGAPVQTLMRFVDTATKLSAELVINIFGFTTKLRNKNKLFNIQSCFAESSKNKLFHLKFEVPDERIILGTMKMTPMIKEQVLELLIDVAGLTAIRVPDIMIDFDTTGIHAFATVLERPDFMLDFNSSGHNILEDADEIGGLYTTSQCAKLCLESVGFCRAFSHCGAACYLATSESSAQRTKPNKNCRLYSRLGIENYADGYLVTTDTAVKQLSFALLEAQIRQDADDRPSILVNWKNVGGETESQNIALTDFVVTAGDVKNILNKKLDDFDDHYVEYKYGAKLKKSAGHVKNHGFLPYQTCQKLCLADPECESLSSCLETPECLSSSKHGDELEDADFVKSSKCLVVVRKYSDSFVEYRGLVRVKEAAKEINATDQEICAKACLNAKDLPCRSFDFCPRSKDKNERCLLHNGHLTDIEDKETEVIHDDTGLCGHYSRNYVRDFKRINEMGMVSDDTAQLLSLFDIPVEECAKKCIYNGGFSCYTFDYCKGSDPFKSTCRLSSNKENETKLIYSPVCTNYAREYKIRINEKENKVSKRRKRFTTGMVVGLGFFFFIFGCGLGIVAIFAHAACKGKRI